MTDGHKCLYRDTWAEINLTAIKHNVSHMKDHIGQNVQLMAVVKANAYGHGDIEVARAALKAGADLLAVAFLDEAISLEIKALKHQFLYSAQYRRVCQNRCSIQCDHDRLLHRVAEGSRRYGERADGTTHSFSFENRQRNEPFRCENVRASE